MFSFIIYTSEINTLPSNAVISIGQLFFFIIAFIFVLFLAIYASRLVATSKYLRSYNKNIEVIESIAVGNQNTVQLIKVGNRYIAIGNTRENITLLLDLKEDDIVLTETLEGETIPSSFKKYFDKYLSKKYDGKDSGDNGGE